MPRLPYVGEETRRAAGPTKVYRVLFIPRRSPKTAGAQKEDGGEMAAKTKRCYDDDARSKERWENPPNPNQLRCLFFLFLAVLVSCWRFFWTWQLPVLAMLISVGTTASNAQFVVPRSDLRLCCETKVFMIYQVYNRKRRRKRIMDAICISNLHHGSMAIETNWICTMVL